jgi:hypothetical protein
MGTRNFGRYRQVSDADIVRILAWHDSRLTRQDLARQLGVSVTTIGKIIQTRGQHYKTESPEIRRQRDPGHMGAPQGRSPNGEIAE